MIGPPSGAASPSLVATQNIRSCGRAPRLTCEIVREMREIQERWPDLGKRTLALVACGRALIPGQKTMPAYFQAPSEGASPRDKADTPPPASPISARPNTPFLPLPKAFLSALCGRRRLRFLDGSAAFLELARGHLACADSSCWRVCRFPEFYK